MLGRFVRDGHNSAAVLTRLQSMAIELVPLAVSHAALIAEMLPKTQALGLSLGDRACLALAAAREIPALTADQSWVKTDIGVDIQLIR